MKGIARADVGLFILRLGLGLTMLFFGSQKVFGLFGGYGYSATVSVFHDKMGIPIVLAHIGILGEFLGGGGVLLRLSYAACQLWRDVHDGGGHFHFH